MLGGAVTGAFYGAYAWSRPVEGSIVPSTHTDPTIVTGIVAVIATGAAVLVTGLFMLRASPTPDEEYATQLAEDQKNWESSERLRRIRQERAWSLTKEARTAASSGDCARVEELAVQVRALDPGFHAAVFARDVTLQRCLPASGSP
jgi:hypothetical protein